MTCGSATIEADDDSSGHHIVADPYEIWDDWEERERYRDYSTVIHGRMMTFMAGGLAEIEFFGDCAGGDGDDQMQVVRMARDAARVPEVSGDWDADRDRHIERLRVRAAHLVKRHRQKIGRVASELLLKRSLAGEEIDEMLF